jgi:hypothetical protein
MIAVLPSPILALAAAEPAAQPVSIETALLVILGLGLLWAVKSLVELHRRVAELGAAIQPKRRPSAAPAASGTLSPQIVAVITAAVHDALGSDHRIVSINADGQNPTWSQEGRRHIFSTRKVR